MDDVMVMNLPSLQSFTNLEPHLMEQIDFLGSQMRRVRPQVKDVFLTVRRIDFER